MANNASGKSLNVLVARPHTAAEQLVNLLTTNGIAAQPCIPFDYTHNQTSQALASCFEQAIDIAIFVSPAAVEFAEDTQTLSKWPVKQWFAVGASTQKRLSRFGVDALAPECYDSEGLLALPELEQVEGKRILIVRGDGGRELIARTLQERRAFVQYFESYRRVWRKLPENIAKQWKAAGINCIVVTSVAIFAYLAEQLDLSDSHWRQHCRWLVVSNRIAEAARAMGITEITVSDGANNHVLLQQLTQLSV